MLISYFKQYSTACFIPTPRCQQSTTNECSNFDGKNCLAQRTPHNYHGFGRSERMTQLKMQKSTYFGIIILQSHLGFNILKRFDCVFSKYFQHFFYYYLKQQNQNYSFVFFFLSIHKGKRSSSFPFISMLFFRVVLYKIHNKTVT